MLEELTRPVTVTARSLVRLHRFLARALIPRFVSIRTSTDSLTSWISQRYPAVPDVHVLPRFHNYAQLQVTSKATSIKDIYPQYGFVVAYCGALDGNSKAYQVMDAVRGLLLSPTIGLIFFGDGPARRELEKRAEILGVTSQISFERERDSIVQYLASVDVLVVPEDTSVADELVIMAAFARVPVVSTLTAMRSDYFLHGESILLCGPGEVIVMGKLVNQLLNDRALRETIRMTAYNVVAERLHEDPDVYRLAYRDSVETALFARESEDIEVTTL